MVDEGLYVVVERLAGVTLGGLGRQLALFEQKSQQREQWVPRVELVTSARHYSKFWLLSDLNVTPITEKTSV